MANFRAASDKAMKLAAFEEFGSDSRVVVQKVGFDVWEQTVLIRLDSALVSRGKLKKTEKRMNVRTKEKFWKFMVNFRR